MADTLSHAFLGYDLRLADAALSEWAAQSGVPLRLGRLASSYDRAAVPPICVADGAAAYPWQHVLPPTLWADAFWPTFGLFRSDRDALSVIGDTLPEGIGLYAYTALWLPRDFPSEPPLGGMIAALAGDTATGAAIDFAPVGFDLLDRDGVSVVHLYRDDLLGGAIQRAEDLVDLSARLALPELVLIGIARASHAPWLPYAPQG